ncbi:SDR family NAD(P)-dependent oxidoreductase [Blautia wexlerae]|uniref:SDR family NAD(P)-dependent oxidoreductase n=1 Tax=Blautia wexlerae TaxID=418240 RepID=UPI001FA6D5B3|nr:SDR family NAD(P)-dependent oxidoreductase [Blautia wexlerae]
MVQTVIQESGNTTGTYSCGKKKKWNEVSNNMESKQKRTALVTGGSSGIGRCTAVALSKAGYIVYEFSRRDVPVEGVRHMCVDVTDEASVQEAVGKILLERGSIEILVNCAGFGISGAVEFTESEQAKAQFNVNFFGTVNVSRAVLPSMRRQHRGHIVNISSVAAVAHIPFQAFYSASKAAVSSYSCALDNEVSPYGVRVTAVELGDIHTGFTQARQKTVLGDDEYGGRISHSVSQMEKDELSGMSPEVIGTYIARLAQKKNCASICVAGVKYKILRLLCKILPCTLRGKIVGSIYAK